MLDLIGYILRGVIGLALANIVLASVKIQLIHTLFQMFAQWPTP